MVEQKPGGDLLRRPAPLEPGLDGGEQARRAGELAGLRAPRALVRPALGLKRALAASLAGRGTDRAPDRRAMAAKRARDLGVRRADGDPAADPLALGKRQPCGECAMRRRSSRARARIR